MTYHFTRIIQSGPFDIRVDPAARYGYFEHDTEGDDCGGGLWFESLDGGVLALIDYDGVFELPHKVAEGLRALGYIVNEEF